MPVKQTANNIYANGIVHHCCAFNMLHCSLHSIFYIKDLSVLLHIKYKRQLQNL